MRKYFGTDGVRGRANVFPMTADFALKLGQAVGKRFLNVGEPPHQIVIGKDTRLSCYMFEAALTAGLCSQGIDVVIVGSIPTPAIAFMTKSIRASAGIVISASHNPYYDNGIKIFDSDGYKLSDAMELELEEIINTDIEPSAERIGKVFRIETAVGRYVEFAKSTFDKNLDLRGLKVVVDCANGASYRVAPLAVAELGAELIVINNKPDGTNINNRCGATDCKMMAETVVKTGADIGISFDGDGDRFIACDHNGNMIDGDLIMGICAIDMQKENKLKNNIIVATVMSNEGFINTMKNYGIEVLRSQVGDRYVIEEMRKSDYKLGGEQSGHIIFSEHTYTGDGLVSALQLLKVMVKTGKTLEELASQITLYPQVLINVEVPNKPPIEKLVDTSAAIKSVEKKLSGKGRTLVRYSGTEKKLRVMIEGEVMEEIQKYAQDIVDAALKEIK